MAVLLTAGDYEAIGGCDGSGLAAGQCSILLRQWLAALHLRLHDGDATLDFAAADTLGAIDRVASTYDVVVMPCVGHQGAYAVMTGGSF